jgi:hypothetical protein
MKLSFFETTITEISEGCRKLKKTERYAAIKTTIRNSSESFRKVDLLE